MAQPNFHELAANLRALGHYFTLVPNAMAAFRNEVTARNDRLDARIDTSTSLIFPSTVSYFLLSSETLLPMRLYNAACVSSGIRRAQKITGRATAAHWPQHRSPGQ